MIRSVEPSEAETLARPLTNAERACWLIDQVSPMKFVVVAHVALTVELTPAAVRVAIDQVQAGHPLLRVGITAGAPPQYRAVTGKIPLRWVERDGDNTWQQEVDCERATPMDSAAGPLVRVTVLASKNRAEILITFHHVMGDGMSGVVCMRDLLQVLSAPAFTLPMLPMRAGVEDLLSPAVRGWAGLVRTARFVRGQVWTLLRGPEKLAEEQHIPLDQRKSQTRHLVFEPEVNTTMVARCRAEKTTMHGLIAAAVLLAVAEHLHGASGRTALLGCCTPVNLRPELVPPVGDEAVGDEIGMYVAPVVSFHAVGPDTPLWGLARELRDEVERARADHGPATALLTQSRLLPRGATAATATGLLYHPLFGAIAVSNMGAPKIGPQFGSITLEKLHIAPNADPFGSLLSLSVMTVADRMVVNFHTNEGIVSDATLDPIIQTVLRHLSVAAGVKSA